ncbi:hypothetical protein HYFRA_00003243 [Hymenoscyphus fraxineus]|uniref:Uncharacterized protein n=1 Tax=Hymenoscyphus fraxineus TaxID=746836 RepID=A0A9N9KT87_9HELO|nr:hypothetical protein HYFRA_00003243 [Hymenoscyphus fraxineus]
MLTTHHQQSYTFHIHVVKSTNKNQNAAFHFFKMPRQPARFIFPYHDEQLAIKYLRKKANRNYESFPIDGSRSSGWKSVERVFEKITGMNTNTLARRSFKVFQAKIGSLYNQDQPVPNTLVKEISMLVVAETYKNNAAWARDAEPWVNGFIAAYLNILLKKFSRSCKKKSTKEAQQINNAPILENYTIDAPISTEPTLAAMNRHRKEVKGETVGEDQTKNVLRESNSAPGSRQERHAFPEQETYSIKPEIMEEKRKLLLVLKPPYPTLTPVKPEVKEEVQFIIDLSNDSEEESKFDPVLGELPAHPDAVVQVPADISIENMLAENEAKVLEQTLKVERLELAIMKQQNAKLKNELLKSQTLNTPEEPRMGTTSTPPPAKRQRHA